MDSEFNNDVFKTIDARLQGFAPPIKIADYIDVHPRTKHTTLDPKPTTLDGINFRIKPKMRYVLEDALTKATVRLTGERAFAGKTKEDQSHWGLRLSFAATNGTGFREIWRMPPLSDRPLSSRDRYNTGGASEFEFDPRFGSDINAPDVTSLHCAVTDEICNVHIDENGFVLEDEYGRSLKLTPNLGVHIWDELGLKTKFKELLPKRMRGLIDRMTLLYPGLNNGFNSQGRTINDTPLIHNVNRIPFLGSVLGRLPGPAGVSFDVLRGKNYKLKFVYSCGTDGGCSYVFDLSGRHDVLGGNTKPRGK